MSLVLLSPPLPLQLLGPLPLPLPLLLSSLALQLPAPLAATGDNPEVAQEQLATNRQPIELL